MVPLARTLRRGAGRRLHRRGQGQAHGGHPRSASSRSPSARYELLTEKYGMRGRGHLSSTRSSSRAAPATRTTSAARVETIEGMRARSRQRFPRAQDGARHLATCPSACPPPGREVLNSVFLYHCVQAGLDMAIVNSEKLERYAVDPRGGAQARRGPALEPRRRTRSPPSPRTSASAAARRSRGRATLPLDERLRALHHRGLARTGSSPTSTEARARRAAARDHQRPADGGHGRGRPALQRQRADRRRGAAERRGDEGRGRATSSRSWRRPRAPTRGKVVLATVKGDVHDIGKNLVEIILAQQRLPGREPRHQGAARGARSRPCREHQPDVDRAVGPAREDRAADGDHRGGPAAPPACECPHPGRRRGAHAASSRDRASPPAYDGMVAYAKDAMNGLDLANRLFSATHARRPGRRRARRSRRRSAPEATSRAARAVAATAAPARSAVSRDLRRCRRRRTSSRTSSRTCPRHVFPYINPDAARHAPRASRARSSELLAAGDAKARELLAAGRGPPGEAIERRAPPGPRGLPVLRGARRRAIELMLYRGRATRSSASTSRASRGRAAVPRRLRRATRPPASRTTSRCSHHVRGRRARRWPSSGRTRASTSARTVCRRWRSRPPRRSPRCCTRGCASVGLPRPARPAHRRQAQGALPRHARLVRLPGVPAPRGPAQLFACSTSRADRRRADRRLHDGSRGLGLRARLPPPRGQVLQGRREPSDSRPPDAGIAARLPRSDPPGASRRAAHARRGLRRGGAWRWPSPPRRATSSASIATRRLIAEAGRRAAARGLANAEFHEADVDRVDYAPYATGPRRLPPLRLGRHDRAGGGRAAP